MFELLCAPVEPAVHDAGARTWARLDVRDRPLAVLRNTFHPRRITSGLTRTGPVWRAEPSWRLTLAEVTAGMRRNVACRNPIDLMADLTDQVAIIQHLTCPCP
ncbi:hypothetical protein SAMN05444920_14915 [Nonomuraea solani]|uniref:Uncharacterized protein n=1 Tax=Nonomuraea solani TaxID=1144553 RepID=A0A1H6F4I3_9ACTN|nr:hypothetical protein [Nonomuraea solani]SEH03945.1 hypothetical protein SAMN05444920_14915 [Nonomuraea solani]